MTSSNSSAYGPTPLAGLPDNECEPTGDVRLFSAVGLDALFRSEAPRLLHRFARHLGVEEARDIVQEAFARLAGAKADREPIDCPEAFVATVATNVLRDRARAAARQALHVQQLADNPPGEESDPHGILESRAALRAIEQALATMNSRRRRIFLLHRFEQMTYAEIGREVGMSEKGVKKQMAKALLELRLAADRPA